MLLLTRFSLLLAMLLPAAAQAQLSDLNCDDSARLRATLTDVLGASRQAMGLRDPDTTLEIWVMPRNSEWLIVQSYANGTSCVVAMGEHWEDELSGPA